LPAGSALNSARSSPENRLDLGAADRDLIRSWVEAGPVRAAGYHLEFVKGTTPDSLLPGVIAALQIMNTAPRDDLQIGDLTITPELLKDAEQAAATPGLERWACYAVDDATGEFVGLTDIAVNSAVPQTVHVGKHRGGPGAPWPRPG
jgi:hypothetical protein